MKKISAIFILLVMLLCSYGFYIVWYASLIAIHNSQREIILHSELHREKLVRLVFSKTDFESKTRFTFEDDEEEFEHDKQMYDVVRKTTFNDSVYVTCISDTQEENLRNVAMAQLLSQEDSSTGKQLPIFNFRMDHYTNNCQTIFSFSLIKEYTKLFKKYNAEKWCSPFLSVSSPPPWMVIS